MRRNGDFMKKSFCIIGLGKFGFSLAQTLISEGNQVMVIDTDVEKINLLPIFYAAILH